MPYTDFIVQLDADNIESVVSTGETIQGKLSRSHRRSRRPDGVGQAHDRTPDFAEDNLVQRLIDNGVVVDARPSISLLAVAADRVRVRPNAAAAVAVLQLLSKGRPVTRCHWWARVQRQALRAVGGRPPPP